MKKILCIALSGIVLALSACVSNEPVSTADESSAVASEILQEEVSSEGLAETTPEMPEQNIVEVSENNEFIDFEYIENYKGITDREKVKELVKLAEDFLLASEDYKFASEHADLINYYANLTDEAEASKFKNSDGAVKPVFNRAITEDFDGNGNRETFLFMDMPGKLDTLPCVRTYLFFIGANNKLQYLGNYNYTIDEISLLNYGEFKHLIVGSVGYIGADSKTSLWGACNNSPVLHYEFRGNYFKYNCFLSALGWQGSGDLMYFDTVTEEYCVIVGDLLDINKVFAMDTAGTLKEYKENPDDYAVYYIGNTYYCFRSMGMNSGTAFVYEDGKFTPASEYIRVSNPAYVDNNIVKNINMAKAIAEMKTPEQAYPDPNKSEFIDFEYIENYKGITDREKVAEIAQAAENAVAKSEKFTEGIDELKYGVYDDYFKQATDFKPCFLEAFTEDFDGNGTKETFVIIDGLPDLDSGILVFLVLVDSENNAEVVQTFFNLARISMLNYGKNKQLIVDGGGTVGANQHATITGLKDEKAIELFIIKGGFEKHGCFINASGWQGSGDFMYFDTNLLEYRFIMGEPVNIDEVFAMDKTNSLDIKREHYWDVRRFGKNYYSFSMGTSDTCGPIYKYEGGKFTPADNLGIRRSCGFYEGKGVVNIDIDKALATMKKPIS